MISLSKFVKIGTLTEQELYATADAGANRTPAYRAISIIITGSIPKQATKAVSKASVPESYHEILLNNFF